MNLWRTDVDPSGWAEKPIDRITWDDNGFREVPVEECRMPMVRMTDIAGHNPLALGAKPKLTPFWGTGKGSLSEFLGREAHYAALLAINSVLAKLGLEVFLVEAFRSARMQVAGFADRFWRESGGPPAPDQIMDIVFGMPPGDFLKRAYSARKGYLENGVVENDAFRDKLGLYLRGAVGRDMKKVAEELGKPVETVVKWYLKYCGNLLPDQGLVLNVAGNNPHGTGLVVDAVLKRIDGDLLFMGAPSDDTGDGMRLKTLHFFEKFEADEFRAEIERDPWSRQYLDDFADEFGTDQPTQQHYEEARRNRRILYHAFREVADAGGYNVDDADGEYWHFDLPVEPGGSGNGCRVKLFDLVGPAVVGSEFAHEDAARLVGRDLIY